MRSSVLVLGIVFAMATGFVTADVGTPESEAWRWKADAFLLNAYDSGVTPLTIVVKGDRLPEPAVAPVDRAAWRAHWTAASAPFFTSLEAHADAVGAQIVGTTAAVNAAHLLLDHDDVPAIVGRTDVFLAGLDWMGATYPIATTGPGILVKLDQTIAKNEAQAMWDLGYRGEGVKLAIVDTGIRHTHETLKNADGTSRVADWFDATDANCAEPCDTNGHGTHVASTAAGSNAFNAAAPNGVAPKATIFGVKIFVGAMGTWQDGQEGLQGAFDMGADLTSNSWGGTCGGDATVTADLAETLANAGMTNVFAAGNNGGGANTVICPGKADKVVTVGAVDINEVVAGFSSRGPCTWPEAGGNTRVCPDVMAVGVSVEAATSSCDTCYATLSGTSMATPHVAGVTTLLQQAKLATKGSGLSAPDKEAEILLRYTAKDFDVAGPDNNYGWGLAKAKAAHDALTTTDALNLKDIFSAGAPVIRSQNTNTLTFAVANLGAAALTGSFVHKVEQVDTGLCPPTCDAVEIRGEALTLDPVRELVSTYEFRGSEHPAGTYLVTGSFDFTYVDPADGLTKSGSLVKTATFLLKKVEFQKIRAIPASSNMGTPITGGLTLRNVGNEEASNVKFRERFNPGALVPAPAAPPGLGVNGLFANPAPDSAKLRTLVPLTMEYRWDTIGTVAPGASWTAAYNWVAAVPGSTTFEGMLTYTDEVGTAFAIPFNQVAAVTPPV